MFSWLKHLAGRLGALLRITTAAQGAGLTLGALVSWAVKYGPLIAALIEFIEEKKSKAEQRQAATDFERGFRVLVETKDPAALEDAIRTHCHGDGCVLP